MEIPEHLIIRIIPNQKIAVAAELEAYMSFLKKQLNSPKADAVYSHPDLVQSKEELFFYAATFGRVLSELENGLREVPEDVRFMFNQANAQQN